MLFKLSLFVSFQLALTLDLTTLKNSLEGQQFLNETIEKSNGLNIIEASSSSSIPEFAHTLLDDTNATIRSTRLFLYKQRTTLSLNFLKETVPYLLTIQQNLTDLLETADDNSSLVLDSFIKTNDILETQLTQVEKRMGSNRLLLQGYAEACSRVEQELKEVHDTLEKILHSRVSVFKSTSKRTERKSATKSALKRNGTSSCGGIVESESGFIVYKHEESLSAEEACFWIVSAQQQPHASHLKFTLTSSGFVPHPQTFLSIGYFLNAQYDSERDFIWTQFGSSIPASLEVPSPVAFVHFVSSSLVRTAPGNKGFELDFRSKNDSIQNSPYVWKNIVLKGPSLSHRHPPLGQYSNNERSIIVIEPTLPNSKLQIKWWDFENGVNYDSLSIWSFDSQFKWNRIDQLVGSSLESRIYDLASPRIHPVLLIFKSDGSGTYGGFEFAWYSSP